MVTFGTNHVTFPSYVTVALKDSVSDSSVAALRHDRRCQGNCSLSPRNAVNCDNNDNDDDDIPLAVRDDKARKVGPTFSSFNPCLLILVIRCNRQHETVSKPKYSLKKQIWTLRFGIQRLRRQVLAF